MTSQNIVKITVLHRITEPLVSLHWTSEAGKLCAVQTNIKHRKSKLTNNEE